MQLLRRRWRAWAWAVPVAVAAAGGLVWLGSGSGWLLGVAVWVVLGVYGVYMALDVLVWWRRGRGRRRAWIVAALRTVGHDVVAIWLPILAVVLAGVDGWWLALAVPLAWIAAAVVLGVGKALWGGWRRARAAADRAQESAAVATRMVGAAAVQASVVEDRVAGPPVRIVGAAAPGREAPVLVLPERVVCTGLGRVPARDVREAAAGWARGFVRARACADGFPRSEAEELARAATVVADPVDPYDLELVWPGGLRLRVLVP